MTVCDDLTHTPHEVLQSTKPFVSGRCSFRIPSFAVRKCKSIKCLSQSSHFLANFYFLQGKHYAIKKDKKTGTSKMDGKFNDKSNVMNSHDTSNDSRLVSGSIKEITVTTAFEQHTKLDILSFHLN